MTTTPHLTLTAGDPAGVGPEILQRLAENPPDDVRLTLIVEPPALDVLRGTVPDAAFDRLKQDDRLEIVDPSLGQPWADRPIVPGEPSPGDARASLAALDLGAQRVREGRGDALVTAPLSKVEIARAVDPAFRGHTDYLAQQAGLERYGRDYLMAFLAPNLRVALLSTHVPLHKALGLVTEERLEEALRLMARQVDGPIAVAALDPHAGENGLLGTADDAIIRPTVDRLRAEGLDVHGPSSADSLFARAQRGAYRWVLALYHDQGLIAVKTAAFGDATNWTLGLPYLRTSVDHGTAYDIAGRGRADASSLFAVVDTTLSLIAERRTAA
ncbi:MAG: 4-hydroxythreonine-4-phosphate dehydrogenase PdxA [Acidobacteriota bacterium]